MLPYDHQIRSILSFAPAGLLDILQLVVNFVVVQTHVPVPGVVALALFFLLVFLIAMILYFGGFWSFDTHFSPLVLFLFLLRSRLHLFDFDFPHSSFNLIHFFIVVFAFGLAGLPMMPRLLRPLILLTK